jgi:catechol 2,3-dioxygenase-like lactoylglutathione lyase family enzyme
MAIKRMDNVGIVVEDLDAAIEFFTELGLDLEGRAPIEGDWAEGVTGLRDMRVEIAMMRTPATADSNSPASFRRPWSPITAMPRSTRSATCASCSR